MIITLTGATFSTSIGTLDSWFIQTSITGGGLTASESNIKSIRKDDTAGATLTYTYDTENYKYTNGTVTDATGATVGSISGSNGTVTVTLNAGNTIKGKITIAILMEYIGSGEDSSTYTFTINPTPTSATVTLSAAGYSTVSGTGSKSITVANSITVSWSVSASGYTTRTGSWTISGGNKTENITLTATSGGGGSALDLSTLSLAHCSSSKIGTGNKENLTYNQTTHELKVNSTGWYKVSYFTTPVQVGTEIEYTANYSKSVTGNFVGIYKQEDLVDGITEANGSFWPAPSGFGMYAPGSYAEASPDYVVIWDRNNQKIKTSDLKMGDFLNGKTIKLKMLETGVEVYVDGEKITWGAGSKVTALTPGTNYYLGFHNSGNGTPLAQTINYIGPIR